MGVKISELTTATSADNNDVLPIVQGGETKKISKENFLGSFIPQEIPTSAFTDISIGSIDSNHSCIVENLVIINIRLTGVTAPSTGWTNLFNIAEEYRPSSETYPQYIVPYTPNFSYNATITPTGYFTINNQTNSWGSTLLNIFAMYYI